MINTSQILRTILPSEIAKWRLSLFLQYFLEETFLRLFQHAAGSFSELPLFQQFNYLAM